MSAPRNPPAFPCEAQGDRNVPPENDYLQTGIYSAKFPGMSLRDYIATNALSGMLASDGDSASMTWANDPEWAAKRAYVMADAMLAERAKVQP